MISVTHHFLNSFLQLSTSVTGQTIRAFPMLFDALVNSDPRHEQEHEHLGRIRVRRLL